LEDSLDSSKRRSFYGEEGADLVPEVNRLLAQGWSMREIGRGFGISQPTLRKYLRKAGTTGRRQWVEADAGPGER